MATLTREYKNSAIARREIQKMERRGYSVVSMTEVQQRSGLGRILLLGLFAAVWHPKPRVLVVYRSETEDATVPAVPLNERVQATVDTYTAAYKTIASKISEISGKGRQQ